MRICIDKKTFVISLKIALGSSIAILLSETLGVMNATSAGTIALLTIVTTKWETIQLSVARVITYVGAVAIAYVVYQLPFTWWVLYGIYIFLIVLLSIGLKWRNTISVNSVIGIHFLTTRDFSVGFIWNEFQLVLIGIVVAFVINLFQHNRYHQNRLVSKKKETEANLQMILGELGRYLRHQERKEDVWADISHLENTLKNLVLDASEYEGNTFHKHTGYYMDYFEMRLEQCNVLEDLHLEVNKIREMPVEAAIIADFVDELIDNITEGNSPDELIERLEEMILKVKTAPLPKNHEELEKRAILYHVLAELEAFLWHKKRFVDKLDDQRRNIYWNKDK